MDTVIPLENTAAYDMKEVILGVILFILIFLHKPFNLLTVYFKKIVEFGFHFYALHL